MADHLFRVLVQNTLTNDIVQTIKSYKNDIQNDK